MLLLLRRISSGKESRRDRIRAVTPADIAHDMPSIKGGWDEVPPEVQGEEPCPLPQERKSKKT